MFKKRLFYVLITVMLSGALFITACGGESSTEESTGKSNEATQPAEVIELSLAHFFPGTHVVETILVEGWSEAIEKATDGQIKITSYPAGTLLPGPEVYEGVVQGVADIGISVYAYTRGRFPVVEAFMLPGIGYSSSASASHALNEGLRELNPAEIQDVEYLFSFSTGPGLMMMDRPVRELSDIQGVEIGVTSGPRVDAMEALGAIGTNIPMPQFYENLQSGIVVGGVFPFEALQGFGLSEVTGEYITDTPFLYSQMFFSVMNLDTWNSLSPELQSIFIEVTEEFYDNNIPGLFDQINQKGWDYHQEQHPGVEVIELSPEEEARWLERINPIIDDYIEVLNGRGLDGEEIIKKVRELVEKYNQEYPNDLEI